MDLKQLSNRLYETGSGLHMIKSKKARNILRGVMFESDTTKIKKALEKIKKVETVAEYQKALMILRSSPLFDGNLVSREFNCICTIGLNEVARYQAEEIISRINNQSNKLKLLMNLLIEVQTKIQDLQYKKALNLIDKLINLGGVSCYLIRILFYVSNRVDGREEHYDVTRKLEEIFSRVQLGNYGYIDGAIREISNSRTDYFNIYKRIQNNKSLSPKVVIAKHFLNHITYDSEVIKDQLNSYFLISLLDAYLYLLCTAKYNNDVQKHAENVSQDLKEKFKTLSHIKINLTTYTEEYEDDCVDLGFFRECFLLIEQDDCYQYKSTLGAIYNDKENKLIKRTPLENQLIAHYFSKVKSLKDLLIANTGGINIEAFNSNACSSLENTCALIYYIEQKDGDLSDEEDEFVKLMSSTGDIGIICPTQYFIRMKRLAKSKEMALVVACLISIKDNSSKSEHALRRIIQQVLKSDFNSNIKELITYLYEVSPSVTEHLIQICDETFLSKLFHITDKPNKAVEDRADILQWYGEKENDEKILNRAKNLKIDVQINKEKGTIDDSRIYVDPIKFTQWINDNVITSLTLMLELEASNSEIKTCSVNWDTINSGLKISDQIATLLVKCYKEFCENGIFGIASYLGRRIRHGTFVGTGLREVNDFYVDSNYSELFCDRDFYSEYELWVKTYEDLLEYIKVNNLHINNKKQPEGFIYSYLNTSTKKQTANALYIEVHNHYIRTDSRIQIPYLITEFCWRIIEEDLVNIQRYLMERKSKHAVYKPSNQATRRLNRKKIQDLSQEVNSVTADKFRTISMWFKKPSFASPSTELILLFNAVLSEVKGFFPDFSPKVVRNEDSLILNGGQYFAIYDALYILIYNAAKYGKKDGLLKLQASLLDEGKTIEVSLTSEVACQKNFSTCKNRIEYALSVDFQGAHLIEGESGIKKLRQLKNDDYIKEISYKFPDNRVTASFSFKVGY